MRTFNYSQEIQNLLTPEIVQLLTCIHEHKGRQDLFLEANTDELKTLVDVAMIQSTGASNRIEGIFTSDKRLEALVSKKAEPHNRSEQEIAGYCEVLALIHENHDYISPAPNVIRQLHRDLYSYSTGAIGGDYKNADNVIAETDAQGHQRARFIPVLAFQTADAMDSLCQSFQNAWRAGYIVGKYISLEMLIEKTKTTYYEALQASSFGWHENQNTYAPFVKYYLGIIIKAYDEFEDRIQYLVTKKISKPARIKAIISQTLGKISKKDLMERCPDISQGTIERTLSSLVKEGYIIKVGSGPATAYIRKR